LQIARRYELAWLPHDVVAGLVLTTMLVPVGIAYAIWSGVGQVLVMFIAWVMYRQMLDAAAFVGIGFILTGVLILALFSKSMPH
jgi:small multidrug resistance pump